MSTDTTDLLTQVVTAEKAVSVALSKALNTPNDKSAVRAWSTVVYDSAHAMTAALNAPRGSALERQAWKELKKLKQSEMAGKFPPQKLAELKLENESGGFLTVVETRALAAASETRPVGQDTHGTVEAPPREKIGNPNQKAKPKKPSP